MINRQKVYEKRGRPKGLVAYKKINLNTVKELRAQGMSWRNITIQMKISHQSLQMAFDELGIKKRPVWFGAEYIK